MSTAERFLRFNGVGVLGIGVQLVTVDALGRAGVHPAAATAVGVTAAVVHNFIWHRLWTWADRPEATDSIFLTFLRFALANGLISLVGNVAIVTLLTAKTPMGSVTANVVAIAVCGFLNFSAADRVVFRKTVTTG